MTKCLTYKSSSLASLALRLSQTASQLPRAEILSSAASPISVPRRLSSTASCPTSITWPGTIRWISSSGPCWLNTLTQQGTILKYSKNFLTSLFVYSLEKLEPAATTIVNMKSKNKKSVLSTSLGASIILTLILKASLDSGNNRHSFKSSDY